MVQPGGLGAGKMACLGNLQFQQGGLGTGKIACLRSVGGSVRWFRRRKDCVPKICGGFSKVGFSKVV